MFSWEAWAYKWPTILAQLGPRKTPAMIVFLDPSLASVSLHSRHLPLCRLSSARRSPYSRHACLASVTGPPYSLCLHRPWVLPAVRSLDHELRNGQMGRGVPVLAVPKVMHGEVELGGSEEEVHAYTRWSSPTTSCIVSSRSMSAISSTRLIPSAVVCISQSIALESSPSPPTSSAIVAVTSASCTHSPR